MHPISWLFQLFTWNFVDIFNLCLSVLFIQVHNRFSLFWSPGASAFIFSWWPQSWAAAPMVPLLPVSENVLILFDFSATAKTFLRVTLSPCFICTLSNKCGGNKRLLRRYKTEAGWKGFQTLLMSVLKSQTLFISRLMHSQAWNTVLQHCGKMCLFVCLSPFKTQHMLVTPRGLTGNDSLI